MKTGLSCATAEHDEMDNRDMSWERFNARRRAYRNLTPQERQDVDAMRRRLEKVVEGCGPVTSLEIVAAIGELLADGRARA